MSPDRPVMPLVLGAGGMLGTLLAHLLEATYPETVAATRDEIDVTDRFRLDAEVERLRPTVVINCAAYTDVDGCEGDPERSRRTNALGAENAARAAAGAGCRIIHISTDFVFDGASRRPYTEDDPTDPLSEYGKSKLEGERRVAAIAPDHLIVRTSWLYGPGRANFPDAIRRRAEQGGSLRVVEDQVGSPTYAADLARAIERLLTVQHRGLVHFANSGICSRYEMARAVLEGLGLTAPLTPISTRESQRPAPRPAYSALDTSRYTRLSGSAPRPWREALDEYLGRRSDRPPAGRRGPAGA